MTESIVPRWEWRTFAGRFGDADDQLGRAPPGARAGERRALPGRRRRATPPSRSATGCIDVKRLERVDDDGLEQWRPVLKAAFPLRADDTRGAGGARRARALLDRDRVHARRSSSTRWSAPNPDLLAVTVHKRRAHYTVGGCMVELHGAATRTTATRGRSRSSREDPARVIAALRELGLARAPNVSVARGLKALVGFGARRYAVIDVGTNSVKFHVGERAADGSWRTIVDRAEVTRLGEGLERPGGSATAPIAAHRRRRSRAWSTRRGRERRRGDRGRRHGRAADRRQPRRARRCRARARGVEVEVISGEEEARLAYLAATVGARVGAARCVVFDTGGGSSQFTFGHGDRVDERFSLERRRGRGSPSVSASTGSSTMRRWPRRSTRSPRTSRDSTAGPRPRAWSGWAAPSRTSPPSSTGSRPTTPTSSTARCSTAPRSIGRSSSTALRDGDERRAIVGLQPNRAEVILAGACIVRTVLASSAASRSPSATAACGTACSSSASGRWSARLTCVWRRTSPCRCTARSA